MKKPTALIVLDGFGHSKDVFGNAIMAADISYIPYLLDNYPNTLIAASGRCRLARRSNGQFRGRAYELGRGQNSPAGAAFHKQAY